MIIAGPYGERVKKILKNSHLNYNKTSNRDRLYNSAI